MHNTGQHCPVLLSLPRHPASSGVQQPGVLSAFPVYSEQFQLAPLVQGLGCCCSPKSAGET